MTDIWMKNEPPPLDYRIKLLRRGPHAFTQLIEILIETKQNTIVVLLLITILKFIKTTILQGIKR